MFEIIFSFYLYITCGNNTCGFCFLQIYFWNCVYVWLVSIATSLLWHLFLVWLCSLAINWFQSPTSCFAFYNPSLRLYCSNFYFQTFLFPICFQLHWHLHLINHIFLKLQLPFLPIFAALFCLVPPCVPMFWHVPATGPVRSVLVLFVLSRLLLWNTSFLFQSCI